MGSGTPSDRIQMGRINRVRQQTKNRFLNMYELDVTHKSGRDSYYYVASRAESPEKLKIRTRANKPDGVIIYSVIQDSDGREKVVLVRQYRYPIDDYIYEFPAGLVDEGETYQQAAVRELKEETGLELIPISADVIFEKPYFTTVGMTDESCSAVYGYAHGKLSVQNQEESEEIQVVLADREEVRRILKEENVAIMCAYMLMHFLHDEQVFSFLHSLHSE